MNVLPEHIQFIDRPNMIDTSVKSDVDDRNDEVVELLDPLLEKIVVEDVEIQEIWE